MRHDPQPPERSVRVNPRPADDAPAAGGVSPRRPRGSSGPSVRAPSVRASSPPEPGAPDPSLPGPGVPDPPQYSLRRILGVWAAAALPMAALSWLVAPWLAHRLGGEAPLARALLLTLTAGLVWQAVLVAVLLRREQGRLTWRGIADGLWLHAPTSPRTGRRGGRTWWALVPFVVGFGVVQLLPSVPAPASRDMGAFLASDAGHHLLAGGWGWFALVVVLALFNTVLGEELLFRGLLLPRMRAVCGRADWLVNGVLFGLYHLHLPWVIPTSILTDGVLMAYPTRRYRSAWMGIAVHSAQSVLIVALALALVLR